MGGDFKMTAAEIGMLVSLALTVGPQVWAFISSMSAGKIPSWDDLMAKNQTLQAKIDAEKVP
jgi:hypothetical protein